MPVHGSVRSPASSGESPCAVWKNWARKKIEPNTPKYMANETALVAAKAAAITPVPGGVGPVTDVWLIGNSLVAAALAARIEPRFGTDG